MGDRDLDVVVFGATGFVGRLVAGHLAEHAPASARIGLAGRSQQRLEALREHLGAADWPVIVADAHDPDALARLAASTRVVATTVGPYARHGRDLVQACATAGTSYADLTGEVLFVRDSAEQFHDVAAQTGARIVHACGFDSVPSDLGVLLASMAAHTDDEGDLDRATLVVVSAKGGLSGGTIDSMRTQIDALRGDRALSRIVTDPYALSPDRNAEAELGRQPDYVAPRWDADLRAWIGPFVMSSFNTRIVRRSNALLDWSYGRRLRYREVVGFGRGPLAAAQALGVTAGVAVAAGSLAFPPTRALLDRVLPAPGEGPDEQTRRAGNFLVDVHARAVTGARYVVTIAAQGDPGYAATSVLLGQSALSLALDLDALPARAGVLTPATAMGHVLADRLRAVGFDLTASTRAHRTTET